MKNYLMIITTLLLLSSCLTSKKADSNLKKINDKYPYKVAEFTRTMYPCFDVMDTIIQHDTSYDFIEIQCPENNLMRLDTVWVEKYKKLKMVNVDKPFRVIAVPGITKIVNSYIKDSAEINLLEYRLKNCTEDSVKLWKSNDKKSTWIKWLIILLAISIIANILQYFKK